MSKDLTREALHYDPTTIALHWMTAIVVVVLWIIGQTADFLPDGPANTAVWSCHVALGFALAALLAFRIYHRAFVGRRLPAADAGVLRIASAAIHYLLYILLVAVVTLGVVNAFVRGYNLFDVVSLPQLGDKELRHAVTEWHGLLANLTLALAAAHAAAALTHRFVRRDAVLARMTPGARVDSYYRSL